MQDIIKERIKGQSFDISFGQSGLSAMPGVETGERHAKWTNAFGQIVGSQLVNIVLAENLNLAGGMIALAERGPDGLPTEAGNLQIKAASIIASTLHDFDNGSSYGVAFGLLMDPAAKLGPSDMRLKVGVDRSSRDVYSALSISDAAIITDSIIGELADPSSRVGEIDRTHGSMDSIIPTRDLWDFVAEKIASEKLLYEKIGVAAGDENDDPATIFKDVEEDQAIDNLHTEAIEFKKIFFNYK